MKLAVDARMMGAENTRGIGRVVSEFVRAALAVDSALELVLLEKSPQTSIFEKTDRVEHVKADASWYSLAEQVKLPWILARTKADLLFFPHWNVPVFCPKPFVLFLHDLILLHHPESAKISTRQPIIAKLKHIGFRITLWFALRRARVIFVPTHFVAEEVRQRFPWAATRICVVGEGVTQLPDPEPVPAAKAPYLLTVGSAYPHKRLDLLISAWPTLKVLHPNLRLVLAGERDVFMERLVDLVKAHALADITFLGRQSDAQLADLYKRAELFVFPSEDEGFGLPPLEALLCGCPVVSSDSSTLPEVLPHTGVRFFRSNDQDDMIRAIDQALRDRTRLVRDMPEAQREIRRHDWQQMARRLIERIHATVPPSFPR